MEFQTLAEFLAQLYPKEAEIFRNKANEPTALLVGVFLSKFCR